MRLALYALAAIGTLTLGAMGGYFAGYLKGWRRGYRYSPEADRIRAYERMADNLRAISAMFGTDETAEPNKTPTGRDYN